jgi:hypothetical protein
MYMYNILDSLWYVQTLYTSTDLGWNWQEIYIEGIKKIELCFVESKFYSMLVFECFE